MIRAGAVAMLAVAMALGGCSDAPGEQAEKPSTSTEWTATQQAEAEKMFPMETLPKGAPAAPVSGACMQESCEVNKVQFARRDWPKAWQGDYQAQRNVAFCRSNGCEGAVASNKVEACAWRSIILVAHVGATDDSDTQNLKADCGNIDQTDAAVATGSARQIFEKIYGKRMPSTR